MLKTLFNFFVFVLIEVMFVGVVADAMLYVYAVCCVRVLPNGKAFAIPNITAVAFFKMVR